MRKSFVALCLTVAATGCSIRAPTPEYMGVGQGESFRVEYMVRCRKCSVYYTAGREAETAEVSGVWNESVRVRDNVLGSVFLTVSPAGAGVYVEHAYIAVDGRKVAEERRTGSGSMDANVNLSAPLVKRR